MFCDFGLGRHSTGRNLTSEFVFGTVQPRNGCDNFLLIPFLRNRRIVFQRSNGLFAGSQSNELRGTLASRESHRSNASSGRHEALSTQRTGFDLNSWESLSWARRQQLKLYSMIRTSVMLNRTGLADASLRMRHKAVDSEFSCGGFS